MIQVRRAVVVVTHHQPRRMQRPLSRPVEYVSGFLVTTDLRAGCVALYLLPLSVPSEVR